MKKNFNVLKNYYNIKFLKYILLKHSKQRRVYRGEKLHCNYLKAFKKNYVKSSFVFFLLRLRTGTGIFK